MSPVSFYVVFEPPFWVGIIERDRISPASPTFSASLSEPIPGESAQREYAKIIFGSEPSPVLIYERLKREYRFLRFTPCHGQISSIQTAKNPKRLKREIARQTRSSGEPKKALDAAKEAMKAMGKQNQQIRKEEEKTELDRKFLLKQQKKKEKHRGH